MDVRSDMARIISSGLFSGPKRSLRSLGTWFHGAPRLWTERRHRRVKWAEGAVPDSEEAEAIQEAVAVHGYDTYGDIARYAADRFFRRDHAAAGWLADIGLFHGFYLLHACESLERLHRRLVWIEDEASPWI
jgi:hypothetical protein